MTYTDECRQIWADSDKCVIKRKIKELAEDHTTKFEFEYTLCAVCPIACINCNFCWDMFYKTKDKNIDVFINMLSKIIDSYYSGISISNIYFLRSHICSLCEDKCEQIVVGTECVAAYLSQTTNVKPFDTPTGNGRRDTYFRSCRNPNVFVSSDYDDHYGDYPPFINDTIPTLSVDGACIIKVINKLWSPNEENETSSEEGNNNP